MKTFVRLGALVAVIALVACGSHKSTTVETSNGAATVTQDANGQSTTIQTQNGTVTVGKSADPAQLGAPVYPGADANNAGTVSYSGSGTGAMAAFKTTDDFDKVHAFYQSQMPKGSELVNLKTGDTATSEFEVMNASGDTVVQISGKPGETDIVITHKNKQ